MEAAILALVRPAKCCAISIRSLLAKYFVMLLTRAE
jgi:hypothetical protein